MREFLDLEDKMVIRDTIDGEQKTVAFICYRKFPEQKRMITGVFMCLPHLDPYDTAVELMDEVRVDHPVGEWSIETPPEWCSRPEYLTLIMKGKEDGHQHYDVVGEYAEGAVEFDFEMEFREEASSVMAGAEFPTIIIKGCMNKVDEQIAKLQEQE